MVLPAGQPSPPDDIAWLDAVPPGDDGDRPRGPGGRRPVRWPLLVVALVLGWALLPSGGGSDETGDDLPPAPTGRATDPAVPAATGRLLATLSGRLVVAITSPLGDAGRVLWFEPGQDQPRAASLETLRQISLDVSGRWLAGLGAAPGSGGGAVLWAGPVGEPLEPVEVGIRGYAWHDTRPGHLAWTAAAPLSHGALVTVNLSAPGPARRARSVDNDDRLRRWGDWGFSLASWRATQRVTVLDPVATPIARDQPGTPAGWIPGAGVVVSAGRAGLGTRALGDDGTWHELPWVGPDEVVTDVAVAPDGVTAAVHLGPRTGTAGADGGGGGETGRVVVVRDGRPVRHLPGVTADPALAWDGDGSALVVARPTPVAATERPGAAMPAAAGTGGGPEGGAGSGADVPAASEGGPGSGPGRRAGMGTGAASAAIVRWDVAAGTLVTVAEVDLDPTLERIEALAVAAEPSGT